MFLCYADESGYAGSKFDKSQPVLTMVGMFPNAYNYHRSDSEFKEVFSIIKEQIPIAELKGQQIYRGRGKWETIPPDTRDKVIEFYVNWITKRKHHLIILSVDNEMFFHLKKSGEHDQYFKALTCPYLLAGLHMALVVQKCNRNKAKNKGKTLMIFDEQDQYSDRLTDLIFCPPDFIDDFVRYDAKKEEHRLNQIIDTCFFVKSHHSSMAQVVDIVAYLHRLHLELTAYGFSEKYKGEKDKINKWIGKISGKIVPFNFTYPKSGKGFVEFLNRVKAKGI